jgi:sugar lactone lactonase YvrE
VSFHGTSFASQFSLTLSRRKPAWLLGLLMLCSSPVLAQVVFDGAQSTVPATGLSGPMGAAVDSSGNLYITDTTHNRIVKITPTGVPSVVSLAPLTVGSPQGLAFDGLGNLYVSDSTGNRVVKLPAGGGGATVFATVVTPLGLAVDANGNVFVADNEDGSIVKITSGGVKSDFATGFTDPVDVAVDAAGNVYVADGTLSTILEYAVGGGGEHTNVGSSLTNISGVAVDHAGNVYICENGEGSLIVKITPLGVQTTLAVSGLASAAYLAVDSNYDLFIPDANSNDVIEFSTISVPLGFANVCQSNAPAPCSQTAILQFEVIEDGISSISTVTTGDANLDFSAGDGGTCSGSTSPCVVQVTFAPTQPGMRTGAVVITDSNTGQDLSVPVYGTGNAANAGFSPALTSPPFGNDGFQDVIALAVSGAGVYSENFRVFIADDEACVIWVTGAEEFEVFAGTYGSCGYSGDGGPATSAELGNPEDVALDGAGNVYIADAANGVIRKVDRNGNISTVAGDNERSPGFSGDGGPATNAALDYPNGIALDTAGNLYIADTNNNRIRKVDLGGIITSVAGSTSGYSGDGGPATSAKLNSPYGVRSDAAGNLFIADSGNNLIRKVDLTGTITTVAGNFGVGDEGNSGDGGPATSAQLAFPIFVSVSAAGELFISDDDNLVIRRVDGNGIITTFAVPGSFPGDLVVDPTGNMAVVDYTDETLTLIARTVPNGNDFGSQNVNTPSTPQDVTVTNIGNQPLIFATIAPPTGFNLSGPDTSCATSSHLSIGIDCILGIVFDPPTAGGYEDVVALTDNSLGPTASGSQNIGVTGTGVLTLAASSTTLVVSPTTAFVGQTVTLTATVTPALSAAPGSVDFCLGGPGPGLRRASAAMPIGSLKQWKGRAALTPQTSSSCGAGTLLQTVTVGANGIAILTLTNLSLGANSITAVYSGNGTLDVSTSDPSTVTIEAAATTTTTITISPNPGFAGQSVTLTGNVTPFPTVSPLGTITFCDSGSVGPSVRRSNSHLSPKTGRTLRSAIREDGQVSPCGADTSLGSGSINAQGAAILALTTLAAGDHNIYAVFSGTVGFAGSVSDPIDELVNTAYTVTAPQTPFTVGQGGSVTVNVTVPPLGGGSFDNLVTMSATGLPTGATATFNPPTVTPGSAGAPTVMTIQLLVVTPASAPSAPQNRMPFLPFSAAVAVCCAFFFYQRAAQGIFRRALLFTSIFLVAALLSACNGGFASKPGTIPGNYVITVTGTSGSLHPSTTVTITVQ